MFTTPVILIDIGHEAGMGLKHGVTVCRPSDLLWVYNAKKNHRFCRLDRWIFADLETITPFYFTIFGDSDQPRFPDSHRDLFCDIKNRRPVKAIDIFVEIPVKERYDYNSYIPNYLLTKGFWDALDKLVETRVIPQPYLERDVRVLTGVEFNARFRGQKMTKLVPKNGKSFGFEYRDGLNVCNTFDLHGDQGLHFAEDPVALTWSYDGEWFNYYKVSIRILDNATVVMLGRGHGGKGFSFKTDRAVFENWEILDGVEIYKFQLRRLEHPKYAFKTIHPDLISPAVIEGFLKDFAHPRGEKKEWTAKYLAKLAAKKAKRIEWKLEKDE